MVKIYLRKSSRLEDAIISLDPPSGDKKIGSADFAGG